MTRVLAIANAKGGVGKTTTTLNLAACLVERKRRVLTVDLDPQASLTLWLGFRRDGEIRSIYDALVSTGAALSAIRQPTQEGFDLVPANHELNQAVDVLDGEQNRVLALRAVIEPFRDRYDYILVDCPANAGVLTASALAAADEVLIPLSVDHLTFQSLGWFLSIIAQAKELANPNLRITGILFTMFDLRTRHARKIMESAREAYGAKIPFFATGIRYSVSLKDASVAGMSILRYEPESVAGEAYRCLAREIEEGLGVTPENELYFALTEGDDAMAQGDLKSAYVHYCRATQLNPQLAAAWDSRGDSAVEWDEQVRCYGRALHLEPDKSERRAKLSTCVGQGTARSVSIHPLITSAHYLETMGENALAEKIYQRVTELDPKHEEAWLGRSRTTADLREAMALAERCLRINPRNDLAQATSKSIKARARTESKLTVEKGVDEARVGNRETASGLFVHACELDPLNDRAWLELARVTDDFRVAWSLAKRALEINPRNEQARELHDLLYQPEERTALVLPGRYGWVLPLLIIAILILAILTAIWQLRLF